MTRLSAISRRTILRGATGLTAASTGMTIATGSAFGREGQGGSGVVAPHTWQRHETNPKPRFRIIDRMGQQEFTCNGTTHTWACYRIEFETQPAAETHNLLLNPNRRVDTIEGGPYPTDHGYQNQDGYTGWHTFTRNAHGCNHYGGGLVVGHYEQEQAIHVSFKPINNSNGNAKQNGKRR